MTGFVFLAASAALLIAGAELFAENAAGAGRRLGVSFLAVGLILAGAEPEEFVTAVIAAARHHPGIGAGDAVGANVTMLTLVIGAACVITPMSFGTRLRGYAAAAAVTSGAAALALLGGVSHAEGIGLVVLYLVVVAVIWRAERRPPPLGEAAELVADSGEDGAKEAGRSPALALLLVLAGIALMIAGGWLAVAGAERLTAALHLADSAVGLTFVALATVAELFALIWAAARRSIDELALAGVLGSALYNSTATLGATAIITPRASRGPACPRRRCHGPAPRLDHREPAALSGPPGRRASAGGLRGLGGPDPAPALTPDGRETSGHAPGNPSLGDMRSPGRALARESAVVAARLLQWGLDTGEGQWPLYWTARGRPVPCRMVPALTGVLPGS